MAPNLLQVRDLAVSFPSPEGEVEALRGIGFSLDPGGALAMVGESGCGKSMAALSLMGLVPRPGRVRGGSVLFAGRELLALSGREWRELRGRDMAMVFQEPMTSLNPVFTVGYQLAEAVTSHRPMERRAARARCVELLAEVGIPEPEHRFSAYPHELSGGLRQRAMIAMAVAADPRLLIADEPTTALDVTVQAQIMGLLDDLRRRRGMALLLITHDLGLVAQYAEKVVVLYAGRVVEEAATADLFAHPHHPYTRGLLSSMPGRGAAQRGEPLRAIRGSVPHPLRMPSGCAFRDRCDIAVEGCAVALPELKALGGGSGRRVRCIRADENA